jgi:hypothetical protein
MRYLVWFPILIWAGVACGGGSPDPGPPPTPPTGFTFETADGTIQSIGWTGQFHGIKGAPLTSFGVKVTNGCAGGVCNFVGPVAPDPLVDPTQHQRCLYQTSKTCNVDSDCPGPGPGGNPNAPPQCVYLYDPPIAQPIPGIVPGTSPPRIVLGACALTYIPLKGPGGAPSITGTLNLRSGALNIDQLTVLLVINSIGDGTNAGVCPVCMGDTTPSDNKKEGTCMLSPVPGPNVRQDAVHAGDTKCDVNRYGDLPGYNYGYSMDCSPTFNGVLSQVPFSGNFNSSGFKISINDQSPKCADSMFSTANCFCGMCSNSTTVCASDSECNGGTCVASSAPSLGSGAGNIPAAGNACDGGVCNWDPNKGIGSCTSARFGGMTVNCYPAASTGSKDGGGNTVSITAPGSAMVMDNVYYADTASARCTAAGPTAASNAQVGLPGLTFQKRNFRIIPSYTPGASQ